MALSDKKILNQKDLGNIIIDPFRRNHLATSSYDVCLGEWYFREQKPDDHIHIYNIWHKPHTDRVWGTEAKKAQFAKDSLSTYESIGLKPDDKIILLEPGETILAHTEEFIGGRNTITTMMKARSSVGRNFIEICKCAGWGDVGYVNRWTMEITNNSRFYTIPLIVGMRVAQIIFFETGEILDKDYTIAGKYQTNQDFEQVKASWHPSMMLPRLYKDRDGK